MSISAERTMDDEEEVITLGDSTTDSSAIDVDEVENEQIEGEIISHETTQDYTVIIEDEPETTVRMPSATSSGRRGLTSNNRSSSRTNITNRRTPRPLKRGRENIQSKSPARSTPKKAQPADVNLTTEADSSCVICLEPFENYGKHRIASLKCGHVFGETCIHKWLDRGANAKCPQCNSAAKKRDIRTIYCSRLVALDVAERDKALENLETERSYRTRLEAENMELRTKLSNLATEFDSFKSRMANEQLKLQQLNANSSNSNRAKMYRPFQQLQLSTKGGSRRVVFDPGQKVLVASQSLDFLSTNQGYGLRKISGLDMRSSKLLKCHDDNIKALAAFDSKVLSGAADKKLCLTCLKSDVVIQQWTMPSNVSIWACEFNRKNPHILYLGTQNGSIYTYDTRQLSTHVNYFEPSEKSRVPITSLSYVPFDASATFNTAGLLVGGFDGCKMVEMSEGQNQPIVHVLGNELKGNCTSLSYDANSATILASFRPGLNCKNVRHVASKLSNFSGSIGCSVTDIRATKIHELYGGPSMKQLTRSCIYPSPNGNPRQLIMSAFDQSTETLIFWESLDGSKVQNLKLKDFVCLDLCPSEINNEHYMTALSDNSLKIFKYT